MSRFYGSMQGSRGEATRQGTVNSGITGHIRGWNIGAKVWVNVNDQGEDEVTVDISGGSNNTGEYLRLGSFVRRNGEIVKL